MKRLAFHLMVAVGCVTALPAHAQYPVKPIRIVVGFSPGGPTDIIARLVGQKLTEKTGQQVIVEGKPGAGGNIAAEYVAKSPADGYTLLLPAFAHAVNPSLFPKLPFDTVKDFAPVALLSSAANVLAVNPAVQARNVPELIALAKARPGQLTYGSAGNGTASHLAGELFNMIAGTDIVHVPYKGSGPASNELMGGHISAAFPGVAIALPHSKAGRMRALAITSGKRSKQMPELPTMAESGLKGFEVGSWYGLLAPAGTPADVVQKLNADVNRSLQESDAAERLSSLGAEAAHGSPQDFGEFIRNEIAKWSKVIKVTGLRAE